MSNFKMRCVDNKHREQKYTIGKIYEVIDGVFIDDNGLEVGSFNKIKNFNEWSEVYSSCKWELIEDDCEQFRKGLENISKAKERQTETIEWIPVEDVTLEINQSYLSTLKDGSVHLMIYHSEEIKISENIIALAKKPKGYQPPRKPMTQERADELIAEYRHEFTRQDWEDEDIPKYYIFYDFNKKEIVIDFNSMWKRIDLINFQSKEKAEEFMSNFTDEELLKFVFKV